MLMAGAARVEITPDVAGVPVHDPLEARALVVRGEPAAFAVLSADVISLRCDFVRRLREAAAARIGIPCEHVAVHCTHNHNVFAAWSHLGLKGQPGDEWAPALDGLLEQLLGCFEAAGVGARQVAATVAAGTAEGIAASAHVRLEDGGVHWVKGNSPMPWRDEVAGRGPYEPRVLVLRLAEPGGGVMAQVVSFACHPTADIGGSDGIGGGYPAYAMRALEARYGGTAVFLNGPSGDVHPADYMMRRGVGFAQDLGHRLADAVVGLEDAFEGVGEPVVRAARGRLELPRRRRSTSAELEALLRRRHELLDELSVRVGPALNFEQFLPLYQRYLAGDRSEARRVEEYLRLLRAMERLCANAVDVHTVRGLPETGLRLLLAEGSDEEHIAAEVQAFRVGDVAVVLLPGEHFARTGLEIQAASPFAKTAVVAFANARIGYVPTDDVFDHFPYPVQYSLIDRGTTSLVQQAALDVLGQLQ
jgi:hypothetical protein